MSTTSSEVLHGTHHEGNRAAPPPSPKGRFFLGNVLELTADWLKYLAECQDTLGRILQFNLPWPMKPIVMVTDPAAIEQVLVKDTPSFGKSKTQLQARVVLGDGLV